MTLNEIQGTPTTIGKVHESVYRSYHILSYVLAMIARGDSKQTIFEIVELLRQRPIETELVK